MEGIWSYRRNDDVLGSVGGAALLHPGIRSYGLFEDIAFIHVGSKFRNSESAPDAAGTPLRVLYDDVHHAARVRIRERIQQDVIDDAVHGGYGANAQR